MIISMSIVSLSAFYAGRRDAVCRRSEHCVFRAPLASWTVPGHISSFGLMCCPQSHRAMICRCKYASLTHLASAGPLTGLEPGDSDQLPTGPPSRSFKGHQLMTTPCGTAAKKPLIPRCRVKALLEYAATVLLWILSLEVSFVRRPEGQWQCMSLTSKLRSIRSGVPGGL